MSNEIGFRSRAVSCYTLSERDDEMKVLIMRRVGEPLDGEWCQVAGRIEEGEKAWQTALRELKEEANLVPKSFYSADICEQFYSHFADAILTIPVFVALVHSTDEVRLNEEHSEYRWMSRSEAMDVLPFSGQRKTLAEIWSSFVDRTPNEHLRIESTP